MSAAFLKFKIHDNLYFLFFIVLSVSYGQNPLVMDQFTADPTARVFNGKLYVYPSHDIIPPEGQGRPEWFNMADYHVFSSENLTEWEDHGVILSQKDVPWGDPDAYSMWAPDIIARDGTYYFYFPSRIKDAPDGEGGFSIGVATSDTPEGPFKAHPTPIEGVEGIDPNVFIDKDGQGYLFWSQGKIYGAKLKDNMLELASEPKTFTELPQKGHIEGPFVFERDGVYYMTYPHVANSTERLEYAVSDHPLGNYEHKGVIMDESAKGTWTNHHSITKYKDQWYLFYHDSELSPDFDKTRSMRADSLFFDNDGNIKKVLPTLRGVGISSAYNKIQIDRYSDVGGSGVAFQYLDPQDTFQGWMLVFKDPKAKVRYNKVDFENSTPKELLIKVNVSHQSKVSVEVNDAKGNLIVKTILKPTDGFTEITLPVQAKLNGVQDLLLKAKGQGVIQIDWLQFVK